MAVIRRYNPNNMFFSDRLMDKLSSIYTNSLTVVEAPTGFGKTTAVRHLIEECTDPVVWFNIDNDDKTKFFSDFYARIKSIDEDGYSKLSALGYPVDEDACVKIANILINLKVHENTIFIFDNYHLVSDEKLARILLDVTSNDDNNFRFVLLTQVVRTNMLFDIVLKNKVNYIDQSYFAFTKDEIIMYCRNCGVKLEQDEADFLYKYTEGWISAVYLQLVHYISKGHFDINASIDKLVATAIWDKLNIASQDFLTSMGIFESFSFRQAVNIANGSLSDEKIKNILESTSLISYDDRERKYYIHSLLKYFLSREFVKLETVFKNKIYQRAGKWYADNLEYLQAIKYYYEYRDYEAIFSLKHDADVLISNATAENKEMFMNILLRTPFEVKEKNPRSAVVYLFVLFVYHDRDYLQVESNVVMEIIKKSTILNERQKNILYGEIYFCQSMCEYNDIRKMKDLLIKSYEYLKCPSTIIGEYNSWTMGSPSVFYSYHRDSGMAIDELNMLESYMPFYYKVTDGHGKGGEAVMKAEILFLRGELESSEVLCQKAIYMSETRKQTGIYLSAMFLLARIAIFRGEYDTMTDIMSAMSEKIKNVNDSLTTIVVDISQGFLYSLIENEDMIPGWLESDLTIEEKCSILNLGFANIIYGKYLIINQKYSKLLGISGQFLGVANIYNNVMYKIYTYIYISIANFQMNNILKAKKFMDEALKLAIPDGIFVPFVENYKYISSILADIENEYQYFINKIKESEKMQYNLNKVSKMALKNSLNFGLTAREFTVAKLAANRLSNKEIADQLFIAESTVKSNMKIIFNKLSINSRNELSKFF